MSGAVTEESGAGRLFEGDLSDQQQQQRCHSGEALAEWRSSDQVENGTPSTSPPYWDSDDDDDGGMPFLLNDPLTSGICDFMFSFSCSWFPKSCKKHGTSLRILLNLLGMCQFVVYHIYSVFVVVTF